MYATEMDIQVKSAVIAVRFWSHWKTTWEPAEQDMKVSKEKEAVMPMHQYGTPLVYGCKRSWRSSEEWQDVTYLLEHVKRNLGAWPFWASA